MSASYSTNRSFLKSTPVGSPDRALGKLPRSVPQPDADEKEINPTLNRLELGPPVHARYASLDQISSGSVASPVDVEAESEELTIAGAHEHPPEFSPDRE